MDPNLLDNLDGYRQHFMDLGMWRSHVQAVCRRHDLAPCERVRGGLAGTCPTFIVEQRWVVKFYGRLFDGLQAYQTEAQVGGLLPPDLSVPVAAILHTGSLWEDNPVWNWPYLIFEFIPGVSIGEVYQQVNLEDKLELARALGQSTRQMQRIPLDSAPLFREGRPAYARFLHNQREQCLVHHRLWRSLPEPLLEQIEQYLLPVDALVDPRFPSGLIHADLTRDHILGRLEADRWTTLGLIDFGDARYGNMFYDLAALHLDLFGYDKRLLRAYLQAYGQPDIPQFPHLAMSAALLHQFNVFEGLFDALPEARQVNRLDDLASMIWQI